MADGISGESGSASAENNKFHMSSDASPLNPKDKDFLKNLDQREAERTRKWDQAFGKDTSEKPQEINVAQDGATVAQAPGSIGLSQAEQAANYTAVMDKQETTVPIQTPPVVEATSQTAADQFVSKFGVSEAVKAERDTAEKIGKVVEIGDLQERIKNADLRADWDAASRMGTVVDKGEPVERMMREAVEAEAAKVAGQKPVEEAKPAELAQAASAIDEQKTGEAKAEAKAPDMVARVADTLQAGKKLTPEEELFMAKDGKRVEDLLQERKKQQEEAVEEKDDKGKWEIPDHLKVPELPLGQTKEPFVVPSEGPPNPPEPPKLPFESFEDLQKQLEEKLKGVPPEDINKITRKFYLDHLPDYILEQQRGVLADTDVIRDASGNVIKKINPFYFEQREKQTNEFLREELRRKFEANSGSATKQEKSASGTDAETEAQSPTATTEEIEASIAADQARDTKEKLESEAKVEDEESAAKDTRKADKEAKKKAKAEKRDTEKKARDERNAAKKKADTERKTAKVEKFAADKKARAEKKTADDKVKMEKRAANEKVNAEKKMARAVKRAEVRERFEDVVSGTRDAIGERLKSLREKIKTGIENHGERGAEWLKHLRDETVRIDYEFRDATTRIVKEYGSKAADATEKLTKKIGSNTVNALKIGVDIVTEGGEVVATGALGSGALVEEGLEEVYKTVQQRRVGMHLNKAGKIEDEIAQTYGHRPVTDDIEVTGSRYESGYKTYQELDLIHEADNARAKVEKIRRAMATHREQAKKLNIFNRAINALFKEEARSSIEYKNPFNT